MIEKLIIMLAPFTLFFLILAIIAFWEGFDGVEGEHKRVFKFMFYLGLFLTTLWAVAVNISYSII